MGRKCFFSPHVRMFAIAVLLVLVCLRAFAQPSPVLAPHKPIDPRVPKELERLEPGVARSMVGGLWMIHANRKASISLKNGLETSALAVTTILYLSNGVRFQLNPITLAPSGTAVISINDALRDLGLSSWATLSGYVEVQYTWAWDPLCVTVTSADSVHSVIFTSALVPSFVDDFRFRLSKSRISGMYAVEGMWWKPEAGVAGFVAISNTTSEPVEARVQMRDSGSGLLSDSSIRVSAHGTKIVALSAMERATVGSAGGLRVLHTGSVDGVLINAGLEDPSTGYSANLPFHYSFRSVPQPPGAELYAELGLMTGAADPMMQFPPGTTFTPFSFARNVSNQPVSVTPSVYWMQGGKAHSARLHPIVLGPLEARDLNVPSILAEAGLGGFNGSVNLILEAQGRPRSLLLASGSVDQKNTYVFQVLPRGVQESAAKTISYWSTANGDDTMVTVWNPADEAQDYLFTLTFAGGHYSYPIHLEPRATQTFNIAEIIQNQTPDAEGNIIPPTIHEGSARIAGSHADNEKILVALDAGTYNVRKATCTYYCISCDGEILTYLVITPFSLLKGGTQQLIFTVKDNRGNQYTSSGTWTSSKTNVASVTSTSGLVTAVGPGTATIYANGFGNVYNAYYCYYDPRCPYSSSYGGSGGGTVDDFTISAAQSIKDGQTGSFTSTVTGGTAKTYAWSYTSPNGAGNAPNVNFTAATSAQTGTDGHWFALPDVACPSQAQIPAYYNAIYTLKATLTFQDNNSMNKTTSLTVNSYWNPAGTTDPNVARVGGIPAMAADGNNVWRVTGMGTLSRVVPTTSTIYVIATSQFYNKTVQHEQAHVNNWILGGGHLYGDLFIPADFYNQIKNTTGTSQADLINKLSAALTTYVNAQAAIANGRHAQDEHLAYAVSDPIAPQYVYQNCGQF